jgi:DUF1009 family protein
VSEKRKIIGLIAGGGQFPVAEAARKSDFHVVAVAVNGETDPSLSDKVDKIVWIKLGQLGHLIKTFRKEGVQEALMAGTITKKRMFENIMPDLKGLAIMSKLGGQWPVSWPRKVSRSLAPRHIYRN